LAAVRKAVDPGRIEADETVVCVITGSALKQPDAIVEATGPAPYRIRAKAAELRDLLDRWR
jgi:threonine synthase